MGGPDGRTAGDRAGDRAEDIASDVDALDVADHFAVTEQDDPVSKGNGKLDVVGRDQYRRALEELPLWSVSAALKPVSSKIPF